MNPVYDILFWRLMPDHFHLLGSAKANLNYMRYNHQNQWKACTAKLKIVLIHFFRLFTCNKFLLIEFTRE